MPVHAKQPALAVVAQREALEAEPELTVGAYLRVFGLTLAFLVGGTIAIGALLLALVIAAPLVGALVAWLAWRVDRGSRATSAAARLRRRWGRAARVVAGGEAGVSRIR